MRKLIEFQILDINAQHYGLDFFELMTNAGIQVSDHICRISDKSKDIIFICGHGNNAGDGYVAANILQKKGFSVKIYSTKEPKTPPSKKAFENLDMEIYNIGKLKDINDMTILVIDCLLGSGIKGDPRSTYAEIIDRINQFENILSVDVPSGFCTIKAVNPSQTITFHEKKLGMNEDNCGEIFVVDIGISSKIDELTGPGELLLFPDFVNERHKGQNGKVAIIGGGEYSGAPALAGMGAYRSGVDLVHVFVPENSYNQVSSFAPELIVHKLEGNIINKEIVKSLSDGKYDSVVIGPGMGKCKESISAVQTIIDNFTNIVIDADAIHHYDFKNNNILLTPHKGELSRLGVEADMENLMDFANSNNLTILLKGKNDLITNGTYFKINTTGHPRMAVGGTGDVLAGLCGGLMGKGLSAFEAARLGSYSFGKAGELCYEEFGAGFLPTDLATCVSKIIQKN